MFCICSYFRSLEGAERKINHEIISQGVKIICGVIYLGIRRIPTWWIPHRWISRGQIPTWWIPTRWIPTRWIPPWWIPLLLFFEKKKILFDFNFAFIIRDQIIWQIRLYRKFWKIVFWFKTLIRWLSRPVTCFLTLLSVLC